jgi:nitroreductase
MKKIEQVVYTSMVALMGMTLPITALETSQLAAPICEKPANLITEILSKRYSGYAYDSKRLVSADQLRAILEAGRLAPSSYNEQPWRFIICNRATNPAAYDKALSTLVEFNQNWAKNAPVLIISLADTQSSRTGMLNRWAQYDTGAAAFSMMLEATSLGLMAHQMGGFDVEKMRKAFAIPSNFEPMAVMAIGFAASVENKQKERKPLEENFFDGNWRQGFK